MLLTLPQIQTLLQSPASASALAAARQHEERIRLHADPQLDRTRQLSAPGMAGLLAFPQAMLPKEKYEKFLACLPTPLPSVAVVEQIFDGLSRLFEAQDGAVTLDMASAELETDFEQYRATLGEEAFWSQKAFRAARRAPHSVLVVDMPTQQVTPRPEPYVFLLDISQVVDLRVKPDSSLEYLLFQLPSYKNEVDKTILRRGAYDDGFYRIFEKLEEATDWPPVPTLENPHQLGYCPARLLWSEALLNDTSIARRSPLTAQLGELDRYVLWDGCMEYYKMYGLFPPLWAVKQQCDYQPVGGEACTNGIVQELVGHVVVGEEEVPRYQAKPCPACALNKYLGPGTLMEVPGPTKDTPDTRNPMGFVEVPVEAHKHARETQQELKRNILLACLGADGEPTTAQPRNEKDVQAGFESRQDVLVRIKKNFEAAEQWVLLTEGLLRYGAGGCRGVSVSRGEEFYLQTPQQLSEQMSLARKAGSPAFVLSDLQEKQFFTQYRNNPPKLDRVRILSDLEPWAQQSVEEIVALLNAAPAQGGGYLLQVYPPERIALKADFPRYVARFESEQADVRLFAALQPYHIKLQLITQTLLSYVNFTNQPVPAA